MLGIPHSVALCFVLWNRLKRALRRVIKINHFPFSPSSVVVTAQRLHQVSGINSLRVNRVRGGLLSPSYLFESVFN